MANITLDHVDAIYVLAAACSARALYDPPDAELAAAAEALAEAGASATTTETAAITAAMATRTTPRARETALDAAIGDFITAIDAEL
jgi:hypothetical protein